MSEATSGVADRTSGDIGTVPCERETGVPCESEIGAPPCERETGAAPCEREFGVPCEREGLLCADIVGLADVEVMASAEEGLSIALAGSRKQLPLDNFWLP